MLKRVLSGTGLAGLAGMLGAGNTQLTPEQAQQLSPEAVRQLVAHAEQANRSVIDSISNFYAQHTTLVKTLGGAALTVALAKVAERQRQAYEVCFAADGGGWILHLVAGSDRRPIGLFMSLRADFNCEYICLSV
jgi:hypothetical protein